MLTGPILAIDGATSLGWAVSVSASPTGRPLSGIKSLKASSPGALGGRFNEWLSDTLIVHRPAVVYYEAPVNGLHLNGDTAITLFGLAMLTETICWLKDIPCRRANNQTVKKFFAGHGHAKKPDMIAACQARGWMIDRHDEADALAVLTWAMDQEGVGLWRAPEREAA